MTPANGVPPNDGADKSLGDIVAEVSEKASSLVRAEVDLAKAEVIEKVTKLGKGAAIAAAAGVFLIFAITMFFHALSWFFADLFNWDVWAGFLLTFGILTLLAAIAGFVAYRLFQGGAPPTPDMAIEQAKLTRAELEGQTIQRDQVHRTLEKGEELKT